MRHFWHSRYISVRVPTDAGKATEVLVRQIIKQCGEPNLTIEGSRAAAIAAKAARLGVFGFSCRGELQEILIRVPRLRWSVLERLEMGQGSGIAR